MVKFFSICLVVLLLCSCHSRRKEIARIVEEWKNKEVIFPDPLLVKVQGRDTILPDFQERKYKILNYIDTSGCTECRMKLAEWQLLKQEIDSLGYDVDILFVAWVHNYDELEILQRANRCQLPFLYDPQGDMQKINQFPAEPAFQTFLLDSLNRVLLIGSPVENDNIHIKNDQIGFTGNKFFQGFIAIVGDNNFITIILQFFLNFHDCHRIIFCIQNCHFPFLLW